MRKVCLALFFCMLVFAACELALRHVLFENVSYSNSESIDTQLSARNTKDDWNLLFIGDSETRWGIAPSEVDASFRAKGVQVRSFNHAFDGFEASWWPSLLPELLKTPALQKVEVIVLGVQLIIPHRVIGGTGEDCGALQRPVLTSAFATDLGVNAICQKNQTWDAKLGKELFGSSWIVKYPSAIRSLLLPKFMQGTAQLRFNSRSAGVQESGFAPHRTIAQDRDTYDQDFARWKAQFPARDFRPLAPTAWPAMTADDGFFDQLHRSVTLQGRRLALFALPTNPVVIDIFNRREDYKKNSALLAQWAAERGVVFVDAGIQDVPEPEAYFSDMRHLSGIGARKYSQKLGEALALKGVLKADSDNRAANTGDLK